MPRQAIQCLDIFPETECTLMLIGEPDEVTSALEYHAAQAHSEALDDLQPRAQAVMRRVVHHGGKASYVGEEFEHDEQSGRVRVNGPSVIVSELSSDGVTTLTCACGGSDMSLTCKTKVTPSGLAQCLNVSCTACGWGIESVGLVDEAQFLKAYPE